MLITHEIRPVSSVLGIVTDSLSLVSPSLNRDDWLPPETAVLYRHDDEIDGIEPVLASVLVSKRFTLEVSWCKSAVTEDSDWCRVDTESYRVDSSSITELVDFRRNISFYKSLTCWLRLVISEWDKSIAGKRASLNATNATNQGRDWLFENDLWFYFHMLITLFMVINDCCNFKWQWRLTAQHSVSNSRRRRWRQAVIVEIITICCLPTARRWRGSGWRKQRLARRSRRR